MDERDLKARCERIEVLVLDVDGVLTDGAIVLDDRGVEQKHFFVRDGSALALWHKAGKRSAILSGRRARCVDRRAAELGIGTVTQGHSQKLAPFRRLLEELGVEAHNACYMGDDLPDLPVLETTGLAACPADAVPEVRAASHYVTSAAGGRGAVREVVELLLRHQGCWDRLVASYHAPPVEAPVKASEKMAKRKASLQ